MSLVSWLTKSVSLAMSIGESSTSRISRMCPWIFFNFLNRCCVFLNTLTTCWFDLLRIKIVEANCWLHCNATKPGKICWPSRLDKIQDFNEDPVLTTKIFVPYGVTYEKIGTIQRRLAWPLHKDDTLSRSGRPTGLNIYFSSYSGKILLYSGIILLFILSSQQLCSRSENNLLLMNIE